MEKVEIFLGIVLIAGLYAYFKSAWLLAKLLGPYVTGMNDDD
jgi:hypothetical protein